MEECQDVRPSSLSIVWIFNYISLFEEMIDHERLEKVRYSELSEKRDSRPFWVSVLSDSRAYAK